MKRQRLTPRVQQRRNNKSLSPQNIHLKNKNKENHQTQHKVVKQHQGLKEKQENTLKICLDLANHHRKEAQDLKVKNSTLQHRLQDQLSDMENLRKQLSSIKIAVQNSHAIKKENQDLKSQSSSLISQNQKLNQQIGSLQLKINELNQENKELKNKQMQTESVMVVGQSKCDNYDINTLTIAKQSRRQQYAHKYESFTFVPSTVCLQCSKKENELQQIKEKYCSELRKLQEQVNELTRSQIAIKVMENQMIIKNQCIDFLVGQLDNLENYSSGILEGMTLLQAKIQQMKPNRLPFDYKSQKLNNSYSRNLT